MLFFNLRMAILMRKGSIKSFSDWVILYMSQYLVSGRGERMVSPAYLFRYWCDDGLLGIDLESKADVDRSSCSIRYFRPRAGLDPHVRTGHRSGKGQGIPGLFQADRCRNLHHVRRFVRCQTQPADFGRAVDQPRTREQAGRPPSRRLCAGKMAGLWPAARVAGGRSLIPRDFPGFLAAGIND